ncbi:Bikaverin cluster transcription factor bik5 like protein [Verticillium longisporum]|uniref:Bikaverin cluster transcription factor bik5 like protein n=1 Tax=Verticillium longisporum TaxID=100787 RepID=A0A8I2ZR49_VERLO|nr:Bikaverin cluster transcription factor bik5 like protein [Verticillium longisporum]
MTGTEDSLHIWNCLTCRRRKVRCDRRSPCSQCAKAGLDCAFPTSGRVPTRRDGAPASSSRDRNQDLLARLNRLEGLLRHIGVQPDDPAPSDDGLHPQATAAEPRSDDEALTQSVGSMFVSEDDTIYIPSRFWRHISEEVTNLRQSFEAERQQSSIGGDEASEPWSLPWAPFPAHHAMSFDMSDYQPLPSQMAFVWQTYCDNVDQGIKILHRKTIDKVIRDSKGRISSLPVSWQPVVFAVSLAAISSMSEQDVLENFRESRTALVRRLSTGAEVSLAKADVLNTTDIRVLQALVLYVEAKCHEAGTRASWCLTGLVVRIALLMGLHRDGSHFEGISPFNVEMRRRLWWHICFIDARSGESQTTCTQLSTFGIFQDAEPPTNIDDDDLDPQDMTTPTPRNGITDASLAIARYHFWQLAKREKRPWSSATAETEAQDAVSLMPEAIEALATTRQKIEDSFLRHAEPSNPRHQFFSDIVRHALARSELNLSMRDNPPATSTPSAAANPGFNRILVLCLTVLELSNRLEMSPATSGWYWALQPQVPWRHLSVLLVQLRDRPWSVACERAWTCLNVYLTSSTSFKANYRKDILWLPVRTLVRDVAEHRKLENERTQQDNDIAQQLLSAQESDLSRGPDVSHPRAWQSATLDMAEAERQLALGTQVPEGGDNGVWLLHGIDDGPGLPMGNPSSLTTDGMSNSGLNSAAPAFEASLGWEELALDGTFADSAEAWQAWDQMMAL